MRICGEGSEANAPKSPHCGIEGFTESPSEHIVVDLEGSLRVRFVEGVITSQSGGWPEDTFAPDTRRG